MIKSSFLLQVLITNVKWVKVLHLIWISQNKLCPALKYNSAFAFWCKNSTFSIKLLFQAIILIEQIFLLHTFWSKYSYPSAQSHLRLWWIYWKLNGNLIRSWHWEWRKSVTIFFCFEESVYWHPALIFTTNS